MKNDSRCDFPIDLKLDRTLESEDVRLNLDEPDSLALLADLLSDVHLEMKRSKRFQLAHVFGLAYLTILEEMEKPSFDKSCN